MKNILVLLGHPNAESYCAALAKAYVKGASASGHHVVLMNVAELKFDYNQIYGLKADQTLEPDLKLAQEKIKWAHHIVIVHPVWWGSVPAVLKAFFDRVLLSGFAFKYKTEGPWWDKLLTGKTARIIYTSDTPTWFYKWFYKEPSVVQLKGRTLEFCGIQPVKVTAIGKLRHLSIDQRIKYLNKVEAIAKTDL